MKRQSVFLARLHTEEVVEIFKFILRGKVKELSGTWARMKRKPQRPGRSQVVPPISHLVDPPVAHLVVPPVAHLGVSLVAPHVTVAVMGLKIRE